VNWLGFPGTMGAPFMDYIVADRIAVPPSSVRYYSEALVYLPDCYLPNDRTRAIGRVPSRSEAGLPETGFVFSAFKIRVDSFAIWMRLLKAVDGSVLWLASAGDEARRRLQHEAEANGVAKERLVFANHVDAEADHLARLSLANLYLDTWPYNAHASACDSLWAGVPMVTCSGTSFAGRVGASLLSAAGLLEMIANSREDYEELALALARDPTRLADLRAKLARLRGSSPLFDTRRFTRHLEAAFRQMYERRRDGLPPDSFAVPAMSSDR
jgi:predicted O-linked N-acetylglucosamine transferase (SPINDLY family)